MEALVLYYSRTGLTGRVAKLVSRELGCPCEQIAEEGVDRGGAMGYLKAGRDAMKGIASSIRPLKSDLDKADCVIIGQPVWAWTMVPAIRGLLKSYDLSGKRVVLFCTMGGSGDKGAFEKTEELLGGCKVLARRSFPTGGGKAKGLEKEALDFSRELQKILSS